MLKLESLNKAQREAVMHGEGPLLVLAGPGSGKTFVITQRILYLIEKMQVPPEEILVITFTKEAAQSMQRRFQEQSDKAYPVNFGTFHSVFYHILNHSQGSNHSQKRQILQQSQKKQILYSILRKKFRYETRAYKADNDEQQNVFIGKMINEITSEDITSLLSAISYYKNTANMETATNKLPQEWRGRFPAIYTDYESARKQRNALDFDDMVYECAELLEGDAQLRHYWQNQFEHILMDEFQDINPMQYRVIKLLAKEPYNLFAVGDDDQAIYGFRGASPDCLREFQREYQAGQVLLNINYRSDAEIVKAASLVIQENKERFVKHLSANNNGNPDSNGNLISKAKPQVAIRAFTEKEEAYNYLLQALLRVEEAETCAVLFRTNVYMQGVAARLQRQGIPFSMKEKVTSIYEQDVAKDIMAYLRLATGENRRELWLRILNKPNRHISREAFAGGYVPILEKELEYLKKVPPFLAVQYVRRVIGYERYLKERSLSQTAGKQYLEEAYTLLDWLSEDAKQYATITAWLEAQERYAKTVGNKEYGKSIRDNRTNIERAKCGYKGLTEKESAPHIHLMTIHAAKGLEFDHVWIPDCNEKVYPHGPMPDRKSCEEERRIFYVGMTRAKKSLELLCTTGTKERPRHISRFLNPLWKLYSSSLTTSSNSH